MREDAQPGSHDVGVPPSIEAVPEGVPRPRWSVMIPTFNCAVYLRETLESVLAQDPGPDQMQIEVIDDCSTRDDPEAVVREIGKGRVDFYRRPANGGVTENFNTCVRRSRGHLVHLLHGDDYVLPGFYLQVGAASDQHPPVGAFFTRCFEVEQDRSLGSITDRAKFLEQPTKTVGNLLYSNCFRTPGVVLARTTYEQIGGFLPALKHCADWEMWVRSIALSTGLAINAALASYRSFPQNDTGKLQQTGGNIRDCLPLAAAWQGQFPAFNKGWFLHLCASRALAQAMTFKAMGNLEAYRANRMLWQELVTLRGRGKLLIDTLAQTMQSLVDRSG